MALLHPQPQEGRPDRDRPPGRAGALTPATAMATTLAGRLTSAGHTVTTQRIT